ncbi:MAG TPA: transcriptional regulator [Clostridium sp.]|nr:transcriptional regulator [Clostridium sp.]
MDHTDRVIIEELKKNSKITMKELGEKIHLSGQATSTRVLKLEDMGIIKGYTINVNCSRYGYPVHAMINIYTKDLIHNPYLNFINSQQEYILHNYKISGDGCYLLECLFPTNEVMDEFLVNLNKYVNYKLNIILKDTKKSLVD